jgi:hypothetical protein
MTGAMRPVRPHGDTQVLGVVTWSLAASITAFSFG